MPETKTGQTFTNRWTPVWEGDLYCSPGCGAKCTRAEYDHAWEVGTDAQRVLGEDWTIAVWENMGWHVRVTKGPLSVRPRMPGWHLPKEITRWRCSVGAHHEGDTYNLNLPGGGFWEGEGTTPREAVQAAIRRVVDGDRVFSEFVWSALQAAGEGEK